MMSAGQHFVWRGQTRTLCFQLLVHRDEGCRVYFLPFQIETNVYGKARVRRVNFRNVKTLQPWESFCFLGMFVACVLTRYIAFGMSHRCSCCNAQVSAARTGLKYCVHYLCVQRTRGCTGELPSESSNRTGN